MDKFKVWQVAAGAYVSPVHTRAHKRTRHTLYAYEPAATCRALSLAINRFLGG